MRARAAQLLALSVSMMANCSAPQPPVGGIDVSHASGEGQCDADPAQTFIGRKATDELAIPIIEATGSKQLRWAGPDTILTMDYQSWRVTVRYDAEGVIRKIDCG